MQPPKTIASKKKLNREDFMFKDKTGEELIKKPGQVNGLDFQIRNLTDCQVYLMDTTAQVSQSIRYLLWHSVKSADIDVWLMFR